MRRRSTGVTGARRKNLTVKVVYQRPDGPDQVMIFGNSHHSWRERVDEFEEWGSRTDLKCVAIYVCGQRFVQSGLKWCRYQDYQQALDDDAARRHRPALQLERFEWDLLEYRGVREPLTPAPGGPAAAA